MVVSGKDKRSIKMKKLVVVAMAAAALAAAAMPTEEEFAKASKDVQAALKTQIASWQRGEIADSDLAALMLMNAGKYKDEARHYVCLQAAFAGAARAGDTVLAANAIEKIAAETKGFGAVEERKLIKKSLEKVDAQKSKVFLRDLEVERAKIVYATPVSDATATTIAKMKMTFLPSVSFKPPATLADAVSLMRDMSRDMDPFGGATKGVNFIISGAEAKDLPKMPMIQTSNISLYSLLKLVVDAVGYDFKVNDGLVVVFKIGGKGVTPSDKVVVARMKQIMVPTIDIKPLSTLKDAVEILRKASKEYDPRKDGVNIVLKTATGEPVPVVPKIRANNISVYNALDLITGAVGYGFEVKGDSVVIFRKGGAAKK